MKLNKIYKEILNEELTNRYTNQTGVEDDVYEIGMVKEDDFLKHSAYDDSEMSQELLNNLKYTLKRLPSTVTLYRVVFLKSKEDLNQMELGSHYVLDKNDLDGSHYSGSKYGANGSPFILQVKVSKNDIDYNTTIITNMKYPHEKEITLKNKGQNAKLINISPFQSNNYDLDSTDDFL
jgi:hypothetical protein